MLFVYLSFSMTLIVQRLHHVHILPVYSSKQKHNELSIWSWSLPMITCSCFELNHSRSRPNCHFVNCIENIPESFHSSDQKKIQFSPFRLQRNHWFRKKSTILNVVHLYVIRVQLYHMRNQSFWSRKYFQPTL